MAISPTDEAASAMCFYHWHIDAVLYKLSPPRVTTLYMIHILQGLLQTCHYDDSKSNVLTILLGTTAFVSGKTMFESVQHLAARATECCGPCYLECDTHHTHTYG
jgi:hypothetical protein